MLFPKIILLASVLGVAHAASDDGNKKNDESHRFISATTTTTNTLSTSSTTSTCTSDTSLTTLTNTTTTASNYADLNKRYQEVIKKISAEAAQECEFKELVFCNPDTCPNLPLDQIVANHSIIISDPTKLAEIFSSFMEIFRDVFSKVSQKNPEALKKIFGTYLRYKMSTSTTLKACSNTPERFLSFDFASMPNLSVKDANDFATFVSLILVEGSEKISLPAVYMLNAFLQIDSMLHHLIMKNHPVKELQEIIDARNDLLKISNKKAHYQTVRNLISVPFSKTVRKTLKSRSTSAVPLERILETVDSIVSQGAIPELRAYIFAKATSAYLLTEEAVQLEFCNDASIYREPYATACFSMWFTDVLSFTQISATPSVTHSILKTAVSSGNLKCIHKVAEFFPAKVWSEVFNQMDTSEKFSISPHLNCNTYLIMSFLKAVFEPLMSEMKTENPILSLSECLELESDQQPQCIYELVVQSFAKIEFPKYADDVDIKMFLLKDYDEKHFANSAITEELYAKVHKMLMGRIGGYLNEAFILNLSKIENETLEAFANAEIITYFLNNSVVQKDSSASLPHSDSPLFEKYSKYTLFVRGNNIHTTEGYPGEANTCARTLRNQSISVLFSLFSDYQHLANDALKFMSVCEDVRLESEQGDNQVPFVVSIAPVLTQFMYENPLLLSSSSFQAVLVDMFDYLFDCCNVSFGKPIVAAFSWDSFVSRGIDVSFFMNGLQLKGGISMYDLIVFPVIVDNMALDTSITKNMEKSFYRNFAYMYFSYYMRLVSHSNEEIPSKDYFPSIIKKFFQDQDIFPLVRLGMQVANQRLVESSTCKKNWKDYVSYLLPQWNHVQLLQSMENVPADTLRKIGSKPGIFGTLSITVLLGTSGKQIMCRKLLKSNEDIVLLLEKGMSVGDGETKYADSLYAFLGEALVQGPAVIPGMTLDNDPVFVRIQFLFNPYYDLKKSDIKNYGLSNCTTLRKIMHSTVKAIFATDAPELFALLTKILYQHYKKIVSRQKSMDKPENGRSIFEFLFGSSAKPATQQYRSSGALQKQAQKSKPAAKPATISTSTAANPTKKTSKNDRKTTSSPNISGGTQIQKQVEQIETKKTVIIHKSNQPGKKVEEFVDYFLSTPTPKKAVAEVTELTSDVASYFTSSPDGIRAPKQNLKKGTHELLLKHANEKGFQFLLDENFYQFLVDGDFKVDTASFGNQLALWKEARQKVPLKEGKTRLGLWVPDEFGPIRIASGSILRGELKTFLENNIYLTNRLCSLLQHSIQGTNSLRQITAKSTSIPTHKVKVQNGILFLDSSVTVKTLSATLTSFLNLQPQTPIKEKQQAIEEESSETENQIIEETSQNVLNLQHVIQEEPLAVSSTTTTTTTSTEGSSTEFPFPSTVTSLQPLKEEEILNSNLTAEPIVPLSSLEETTTTSYPTIASLTSTTTTTSVSSTSTSTDNSLSTLLSIPFDENYMAYEGQLQEITVDKSTQLSRIRKLLKANLAKVQKYILKKMMDRLQSIEQDVVETKISDLKKLIKDADYVAVDFELTGVSLDNGNDPNDFTDCKDSTQQNLIVQVGLMLMKRSNSDQLVQENSGKSVWKIPVCMKGNTEDSIWRQNSLIFLKSSGFDHLAWKVQCLDYSQLSDIWKSLLEKPLLTHNGLLDILHLLRAAGRDSEIEMVHTTDEFKAYLNNTGINVYDTRVLYNHTHPYFSLKQLSEAILPREKLEAGSAHDASFDAYLTGHLCRCFSAGLMPKSRNVLLETKRGIKKIQSCENSSSSPQSQEHIFSDTPTRPNAAPRRLPKKLDATSPEYRPKASSEQRPSSKSGSPSSSPSLGIEVSKQVTTCAPQNADGNSCLNPFSTSFTPNAYTPPPHYSTSSYGYHSQQQPYLPHEAYDHPLPMNAEYLTNSYEQFNSYNPTVDWPMNHASAPPANTTTIWSTNQPNPQYGNPYSTNSNGQPQNNNATSQPRNNF